MREAVALILAFVAAAMVDRLAARRGFDPPGFRDPVRRLAAGAGLTLVFFVGVFYPAMSFDLELEIDLDALSPIHLFVPQLLLAGWLAAWWWLGFAPARGGPEPPPASRLGLRARDLGSELWIGLTAGLAGWLAVLTAAALLGAVVTAAGGEDLVDRAPAEQIVWLASLPVAWRLAISLAAGVVEELFFRGFLQPRVGVAASTLLFVGAHLAYGEPFMLFGVTLLSLFYAWLAAWRRSVWAAMTAHALFDAVQLLLIIPAVLRFQEKTLVCGI